MVLDLSRNFVLLEGQLSKLIHALSVPSNCSLSASNAVEASL